MKLKWGGLLVIAIIAVAMFHGVHVWGQVGLKPTRVFEGTSTTIGQPIQFPHFRNQVTVLLLELAPGGETGPYQNPAPTFEYILEGTVTVDIEGFGHKVFSAGQGFLEPINTWHTALNRGTTPVKAVVLYAGEEGKPTLVRRAVASQVGLKVTPVLQWTTTAIGQPILFPLFRNQVIATLLEVAPGGEVGRHLHPIPILDYILEGTWTAAIEGHGETVYRPGQANVQPVNTWHNGINRGATPVKILVVAMGEEGKPTLIRP